METPRDPEQPEAKTPKDDFSDLPALSELRDNLGAAAHEDPSPKPPAAPDSEPRPNPIHGFMKENAEKAAKQETERIKANDNVLFDLRKGPYKRIRPHPALGHEEPPRDPNGAA